MWSVLDPNKSEVASLAKKSGGLHCTHQTNLYTVSTLLELSAKSKWQAKKGQPNNIGKIISNAFIHMFPSCFITTNCHLSSSLLYKYPATFSNLGTNLPLPWHPSGPCDAPVELTKERQDFEKKVQATKDLGRPKWETQLLLAGSRNIPSHAPQGWNRWAAVELQERN